MAAGTLVSLAVHVLVGAVWVGAVTFTVGGILPVARDGRLNADPLGEIARRLRTVTRVAAVALLLTGGHLLAVRGYLGERLVATGDGHLVLAMVGLWLAGTGLTEAGTARLVDGAGEDKVREPARAATRFLQGAALCGCLVLLVAGALAAS